MVYAIVFNNNFINAKYFLNLDNAKKHFKNQINELKYRPGVDVIESTDTRFNYCFGWEEKNCTWRIAEIKTED
jgi:hypothetical protein